MQRCVVTGVSIPSLTFLAMLSFGIPADAQPPSKEDASRLLGPKGGTILVYELDRSKVPGLPAPRAVDVLVNVLNDRFAPNSLYDVTIRKADNDRLHFILAIKGKQPVAKETLAEELKRIKFRVAKVGSLELSILANSLDDRAAIEDLRKLIKSDGPEITRALKEAQANGQPPPAGLAGAGKVYDIATTREAKSRVNYRWVELSDRELRALNLDAAAKDDPKRDATWKAAAKARGQATMLPLAGLPDRYLLQGALFYSRECKDENLPTEVRLKKPVDFFVLARNPEIVDGKPTARIDGRHLKSVYKSTIEDRPILKFALNDEGADLLGNLTRKNLPTADVRRHLAIILDGAVMSAPTVNAEIRTYGQISGNFTVQELDEMVNILRAGAFPVTLLPRPVAEITIEPALK